MQRQADCPLDVPGLASKYFLHLIVIKLRQFLSLGNFSGLFQDNYFDFYKWRSDLFCRKQLLFSPDGMMCFIMCNGIKLKWAIPRKQRI